MPSTRFGVLVVLLGALGLPGIAMGQADLIDGLGGPLGFGVNQLGAGDDGSLPISTLPANPQFSAELAAAFPNGFNYYDVRYPTLYININGSISFGGPRLQLDPTPFPRAPGGQPPNRPIIAPYLSDVDTRGRAVAVNNQIHWGVDAVNRRLVVTWNEVGYFSQRTDLLNRFQVILTAREDLAAGDFDIEFRYNRCEWTAGERQLELPPVVHARVGFDAANGIDFAELQPFSGTARVLEMCELSNAGFPGGWTFPARGGDVYVCGNGVVEPGEQCDEADVNLRFRSGDGCSANCLLEVDRDCDSIYALAPPPPATSPRAMTTAPARCSSTAATRSCGRTPRPTRPITRCSSITTATALAMPATTMTTTTPSSTTSTTARSTPTGPTIRAATTSTTTRTVRWTKPGRRRSSTSTATPTATRATSTATMTGCPTTSSRATPTPATSTTAASPSTRIRPTPTAMASAMLVIQTSMATACSTKTTTASSG